MAPIEDEKKAAAAKQDSKDKSEDPPIIKQLKAIDDKYLAIEKEYEKECNELMKKYTAIQKPFLEERKRLLTTVDGDAPKTGTPALRGFWLKAMQNHPAFEESIQEWDEPVLEYLVDIEKSYLDDADSSKGFKLVFHFEDNPYFTNSELFKEYHTEESNPYNGEIDTKKIVVSDIEWKAGKNVTIEKVSKKVKGGGAKKAKQKKEKEEARPSFFRDFLRNMEVGMKPTEDMIEEARAMCYAEDEDDEDDDEDHEEIIKTLMENDHEVGMALRDNIIPFAVRWYTGEAAPEEDDEEDEEEEDDDDDDDEDEEESSDDEPAPKHKAKGVAGAKGKKGCKKTPTNSPEMKPSENPKAEECKQQ